MAKMRGAKYGGGKQCNSKMIKRKEMIGARYKIEELNNTRTKN